VIKVLCGENASLQAKLAAAVDFNPQTLEFDPASVVIAGTGSDIALAWHPHLQDWTVEALVGQVNQLYDEVTLKNVAPFDDLDATLKQLSSSGIPLGVATNDTGKSAVNHVAAMGHSETFAFVAGYDSGHGAKPGPGMLLAFAKTAGIEPFEIAMVGDSLHDMHAGKAAGATRIAVTTGLASHDDLVGDADFVIENLSALLGLVDKINR